MASYVAPRRGCAYEEEQAIIEFFYGAELLKLPSARLAHLLDDDSLEKLAAGEDEACGPLILHVPRKYLIEANSQRFPPPSPEQLAVPAPTPTFEDRLRRQRGGT